MDNNMEHNLKKEFHNREILPSENAWNTLSSRLEIAALQKKRNTYKYLAYAAVMMGVFLGIFSLINKTNTQSHTTPIVIDKENKKVKTTKQYEIEALQKTGANNTIVIQEKKPTNSVSIAHPNSEQKKNLASIVKKKVERIAQDNKLTINTTQSTLDERTNQSITKSDTQKKKKMLSSDEDIEALLAEALEQTPPNHTKEISIELNSLENSTGIKLKKPLKRRIIETIKTGVDTVETLLVSND